MNLILIVKRPPEITYYLCLSAWMPIAEQTCTSHLILSKSSSNPLSFCLKNNTSKPLFTTPVQAFFALNCPELKSIFWQPEPAAASKPLPTPDSYTGTLEKGSTRAPRISATRAASMTQVAVLTKIYGAVEYDTMVRQARTKGVVGGWHIVLHQSVRLFRGPRVQEWGFRLQDIPSIPWDVNRLELHIISRLSEKDRNKCTTLG